MKQKAFTIALLILMSASLFLVTNSLPPASAQSPYGIYIGEVVDQTTFALIGNGTVGQAVTLVGTINTINGPYKVYFNNTLMDSGIADGYFVYSNITIPELPGGTVLLTLTDVTQNANQSNTYPFPILASYSAKAILPPSPSQLKEGNSVVLNVTITGGQPNTAYYSEITVEMPTPINTNYTAPVSLITSPLGTAQSQLTFPGSSFSPTGASTIYAGTYTAYFNVTQGLGLNNFKVGFTDLAQYHRQDNVNVNAIGYQPSQSATLSIQLNNQIISSQTLTASNQGVITTSWPVPVDAALGTYTATITPLTTPSKSIGDVQTFDIVGYPITFKALNLGNEPVSQIFIQALDKATNTLYNGTTDADGNVNLNLEKGSHTVDAYWNQAKVGEIQITTSGKNTYPVQCKLTDLKIKVQDKNGVAIPFVVLNMTYPYASASGSTLTGTASGQTDISGTLTFNSTLTGINYSVNASKYAKVFNLGNNSISNVPAQPIVQATILCPDQSLTLELSDYTSAALPNARILLTEQESGLFYSITSDANGHAQTQVTFGKYHVSVYSQENVLLNETTANVLSDTQVPIKCVLYKLPITIKVVDYFGNGISNVNVQLSTPGTNSISEITQGDGTATFLNAIGGNIEVTAYLPGSQSSYVASNLHVDSSTPVRITMGEYVLVGGAVVGASALAAMILIVIAILSLVVFELLRRFRYRLRL